ncbi:MAG: hypothetical protein ABIY70_20265 [Capsulimonas sp.]|uniref:hypothetical protein n=1 Tax=Capsulimonas sp. TaxID=2494211 RepID=UPI0032657347
MLRQKYVGYLGACLVIGGVTFIAGCKAQPKQSEIGAEMQSLKSSKDPKMQAAWQKIESGPKDLAAEIAAARSEGIDINAAPPVIPPDQDAAPIYKKWNALRKAKIIRMPNYSTGPSLRYAYTPEQISVMEHLIDDNPDRFALLHEATDRPKFTPSDPVFPIYASMREGTREIALETFVEANRGHISQAIQNQRRAFHIAAHTAAQGDMSGWMTGVAIEDIALSGMRQILQRTGPDINANQQVAQAMHASLPALSLKTALTGNLRTRHLFLEQARRNSDSELDRFIRQDYDPDTKTPLIVLAPEEREFALNLIDASEARYLGEMRTLIAAADKPVSQRRAVFQQVLQTTPNDDGPQAHLYQLQELTAMFGSASLPWDQSDTLLHANEQVTLAGAAILETKARTGQYPATLPEGFVDPFTDKPLIYQREGGNGFVVYSVGADGKYDGQASSEARLMKQAMFRYPAPPPIPLPAWMNK